MHPYEMQLRMRERGHERVVKLKPASVYDTVERLLRLHLVEPVETSREGRRPERTVYRITDAGSDELRSWLRDLVSRPTKEYPEFARALMFFVGLRNRRLAITLLQQRALLLAGEIAGVDAMLRGVTEHAAVPRISTRELAIGDITIPAGSPKYRALRTSRSGPKSYRRGTPVGTF